MAEHGLIERGLQLTAYVKVATARSSRKGFEHACQLDTELIGLLQELAPDAESDALLELNLRALNQGLCDRGFASNVEVVRSLLLSLAHDGSGVLSNSSGEPPPASLR
ncbi:MAG: hypothetical protein HC813_02410, partial [Planctomycetes bacterium]|nr:hypothetical protein [Planctomycetota bacterium]